MQSPILVFDGDCAFCSRCADLARRLLPSGAQVLPWQQVDLDRLGINETRARTEVLWVDADGVVSGGAPAVARALRASGGFWAALGVLLSLPPISWIAPPLYRLVARNRYRLPGGTAACRIPAAPEPPVDRAG